MSDGKHQLTFVSAVLQGVYLAIKYLVALSVVGAISWFAMNFFLDRNPEIKARIEQSFQALDSLSVLQTGGAGNKNASEDNSGLSQAQINIIAQQLGGGEKELINTTPNYSAEYANIPAALVPFAEAMEVSFGTTKYRSRLTADKVGRDGSGAIPYLEKALDSTELRVRTAAEESLQNIGTPEALAVLREARGY